MRKSALFFHSLLEYNKYKIHLYLPLQLKPNTNIKETKEICNQLGGWGKTK
jgi:hypothetical protein